MNADDLLRVKQLFIAASELPPEERSAYLDARVPDGPVRARVDAQLRRLEAEPDIAPHGDPHVEDRDPESEFRDIAKYGVVQVAGASVAVSLFQKMVLAHLQDMQQQRRRTIYCSQ